MRLSLFSTAASSGNAELAVVPDADRAAPATCTDRPLATCLLSRWWEALRVMDSDLVRRQALYELLAEPDPPELHRGFVRLLEGKPDRHAQLPMLAAKFVQARLLEIREQAPLSEETLSA
jgi:hypothetical protein